MGEPARDTRRQGIDQDIRPHRRAHVIRFRDLPLPPRHRVPWWIPGGLAYPLVALIIWLDPDLRHRILTWLADLACFVLYCALFITMEARERRRRERTGTSLLVIDGEGQDCGAHLSDLSGRVRDCELTNEMLIETLAEMCDAAGIALERPKLRVVDGTSRGPVA